MPAWFKRIREPSTYGGLAAIAVALGFPAEGVDLLWQGLGVVAGIAAIVIPEQQQK